MRRCCEGRRQARAVVQGLGSASVAPRASTVTVGTKLSLSYSAQGAASDPTLVLLPGPTDSWRSYAPVLEQLPSSIRAVALSQRGHGDSDKPPSGYQVVDFAADVALLLDALDIERAVLCGHSGSCLIARRVAIHRPERVAGLVLEASPVTLQGDPELEEFVESVVSGLEDPIDPAFARSFVVDTSSDKVNADVLDVGHTPRWEDSDRFAADLAAFVQRVRR